MSGLMISDEGKVTEIWLLRPADNDLDEAAWHAVNQYMFKPAQYDGSPVGTVLFVETNFWAQ